MASLQKEFAKLLTLVLFVIIFALQVAADLAPNEEEEENVKSESKKTDETVTTLEPPKPGSNLGFIHAFIASFSVIIVSEIGDKTFFIAAIMSMKYPRLTVFAGAISALALMTVLSAVFGMVFIQFIPPHITRWVSVLLFVLFGLKMLHEGYNMSATNAAEEMEEVQHDIRKREDELKLSYLGRERNTTVEVTVEEEPSNLTKLTSEVNKESTKITQDPEAGPKKAKAGAFTVLLRIFVQAFTMTFVAEWGDRSQITTIILSARENLLGVITGGIIGHAICTGIGVLGGRMIAQKISVKTVTLIGGVVFLLFAITSSIWDPNAEDSPPSVPAPGGN